MAAGIIKQTSPSGSHNVTNLTPDQKQILKDSGLSPDSTEYKQLQTKMQMGNLDSAVSFAKEIGELMKKMRDAAIQGMGR
jgi:hypothetical protein